MTNFLKFFFIMLITQAIGSCTNSNYSNKAVYAKCDTTLNLDTPLFKRLNIINKYNRVNPTFEFIQNDIKIAGLRDYKNGYDSLVIRLWYQYSGYGQDIIEIRKNCDGWVGFHTKIKWHIVDSTKTSSVAENVFINPKSTWGDVTKKLFDLNVISLPDCYDIPNYDIPNDGNGIDVEIATKKYYRIYSYAVPRANHKIKEAVRIENILKLIEEEFGIEPKEKI